MEMNEARYDIIIIGGGPGGLTSAIYTSRELIKTLVLDKGLCGGLASSTHLIENFPGFPNGISGPDLMKLMKEQAIRFGAEITEFAEVTSIKQSDTGFFEVAFNEEKAIAPAVIISSGSVPRSLNIPGEKEFFGRGVSYCAVCDGPFFKDMDVAVIGCGNSGLQEGEGLLKHVRKLIFIDFIPQILGSKILQERLKATERVEFHMNKKIISIDGKDFVESITFEDRESGVIEKIPIGGVFVYAGFSPNTAFLKDLIELDENGYIFTNDDMRTSREGVYAVGDVRSKRIRQIATACADGVIAAISAGIYLKKLGYCL